MNRAKHALILLVVSGTICSVLSGCSSQEASKQQQAEAMRVASGIAASDEDNPNNWAPTREAIEEAKREDKTPAITPGTTERASDYPMNPRLAREQSNDENSETAEPADSAAESSEQDSGSSGPEKLPPSPAPPALRGGDEADQWVLPAWEAEARGDLKVKRIQY